jgi:Holliday junction DNA helicase RuvA
MIGKLKGAVDEIGDDHAIIDVHGRLCRLLLDANARQAVGGRQSIQRVGSKVALAQLSTLTTSDPANAIALQDKAMVTRWRLAAAG